MQSRAGSKPVGRLRQLAWLALVFLFVQAASIPSAFAIDYTVTKTDDTNDGVCDSDCSLREAIVAANTSFGADRVVLGSSQTYTLSLGPFDPAGTLGPGHGDLDVTGPLIIDGNGSIVDGGGIDRVFDIQMITSQGFIVTINTLTIRGGVARGFLSLGGGVRIQVKNFPDDDAPDGVGLRLNNSVVTGNLTALESGELDAGGGIAVIGSFYAATGTTALAILGLNNTTVSANAASNGGGIVCVLCALSASSATITGNTANAGDGGGIALTGNSSGASLLPQCADAQFRLRRVGTRGRDVGAGRHEPDGSSTARGSPPTRA